MTNTGFLFEVIKETIIDIDKDLKSINGTGVFFAPELYVAFCIGKEIYKNRNQIFKNDEVKWARETNLGNGGPSDICFKVDDKNVVIELKLRSTTEAYESDIQKLSRLNESDEKFFCVLVDKLNDKDGRLINLAAISGNKIINVGQHEFLTLFSAYKSKTYCDLNLFRVL
jgi:hypothetical protein